MSGQLWNIIVDGKGTTFVTCMFGDVVQGSSVLLYMTFDCMAGVTNLMLKTHFVYTLIVDACLVSYII